VALARPFQVTSGRAGNHKPTPMPIIAAVMMKTRTPGIRVIE
jgi:hypothetical protein